MAGRRGIEAARGVLSYFTRHGTAANLVLALMVAAGLAAMPKIRAQFFPDVIVQNVAVTVAWSGAGAEDVDRAIVQVLEPALIVVDGVEATSSRASEGSARISLEFEPGWDMSRAVADVEAAVASAGNLPDEAEDPEVSRGGWRDRVTDIVISGPVGVDQLGRLTDELVTRLFAAGVTRTTIQGLAAPETVVEVPSAALIRHDIGMADIAAAIAAEVAADPAGDVSGGAARVRTGSEKRSAQEIAGIVLRSNPDGSSLRIGDLATIRVEGADRNRAYFVGEHPAMTLRVDRNEAGDAIAIQAQVQEVVDEMALSVPQGVKLELIRTRSEGITARLALLLDNGLAGLALVVLLLFLFLSARVAFWVAAGIPVAMLAAVSVMYLGGLTLNMMSLFALIITLGIVVDDAIIVGEHADFRARRLGEAPVEAAENAARRMAAPVFAAVITTIIAFFGLMAIGGRFGTLIADIPFTVIAVLMASLVECFLILPNHLSHALAHIRRDAWYEWPSRQVNRGFAWLRDGPFRRVMEWVIRARYAVLAGTVAILASQVAVLITGSVQWRFFDAPEEGSVSGNFAMLPGATRDDTMEMMRLLQRATAEVAARYAAEHGADPLKYVIAEVGGNAGRALAGSDTKEPELLGAISIELIDRDLRPYSSFQFVADLQEAVPGHPMLEELSFRGWRSGPGGDALDVKLSGADSATLKAAAEALKTALAPFPEVSAVEDNLSYDKDEILLDLTPQGVALGFTIDELGRALRNRLNGIEAATYPDGPRSAAIRVELPPEELTADFLESTLLRTQAGQYVPLADIVTVEARSGFSTIRRENGQRVVSVTGDISEDDADRAAEINRALQETILPAIEAGYGVGWALAGLAEQEREFLADAATGFFFCLVGIYIALAWIFSSWTRPLVVMSVIPFGLIGVVIGHTHWGVPMSMFSVVGLIGMAGIIINDSIVLVATIDDYARNRSLIPAIVDATVDRLRPVLLTTLTTVLGLAPLLYEGSSQAEFLKATVITLCYGLGFGMVLVLLVVPALVAVQQDLGRQFTALRRALRPGSGALRLPVALAALAVALAFAATMGHLLVTGALPGPLGGAEAGPLRAFGLFLGLSAAVVLAGIAGALVLRARAGDQPGQP